MQTNKWQYSIKIIRILGCSFLTLLVLNSCTKSKTPISNLEMGNILDNKGKAAQISGQVPYYTEFMLKKFEREYKARPEQMRYSSALDYSLMLLLNGQNQKAINVLIEFLNSFLKEPTSLHLWNDVQLHRGCIVRCVAVSHW